MDTYIYEEFLLQTIFLVAAVLFMLPFLIAELAVKKETIDFFTRYRLKKVGRVAYKHFVKQDFTTAKQKTAQYMREVYNKGLLNEKYDIARRA